MLNLHRYDFAMDSSLPSISLLSLCIAFIPGLFLLAIIHRWSLKASSALYANVRMPLQLLIVGYVLTYIFETEEPAIIIGVVLVMVLAAAWIALRPVKQARLQLYPLVAVAVAGSGLTMLGIVTQIVLDLPRWYEPRFVVPLAGMIFANLMNTVSLAAERFESELARKTQPLEARRVALEAAIIPQINSLLAVGLVSLPGMMTGQILSGVDPQVAVRYQVMVMCMVFGSGGMAAAIYLTLRTTISTRHETA
jgi:putative ABC transport system permease protein